MPRPDDWLVLTHTHPGIRNTVPQPHLLDALPEEARDRSVDLQVLSIHERQLIHGLQPAEWAELQARQATLFHEAIQPLLDRHDSHRLAYFGATYIPLAIDLGLRVGTWRRVDVFLHHHTRFNWVWSDAPNPDTRVQVTGIPQDVLGMEGEALLRIATSYGISDADARAICPTPIADIQITLNTPGVDAIDSPALLEEVVSAFRGAMEHLQRNRPGVTKIHLLLAGPVGLAFRIGAAIPTSPPPIAVYQYESDLTPRHRLAFILDRQTRMSAHSEDHPQKILFLASQPRDLEPLRLGEEHDEIIRRLKLAPAHTTKLLARQAAKKAALQETLDDERPDILHFSGHGDASGNLLFERPNGISSVAPRTAMVALFKVLKEDDNNGPPLRLAVLNACHSALLAEELVEAGVVDFAIGMDGKIDDGAAILFSDAFYRRLFKRKWSQMTLKQVHNDFRYGLNRIQLEARLQNQVDIPQLFPKETP